MTITIEGTKAEIKKAIVDTERTMAKLKVEYNRLKDITHNLKADLRLLTQAEA